MALIDMWPDHDDSEYVAAGDAVEAFDLTPLPESPCIVAHVLIVARAVRAQ